MLNTYYKYNEQRNKGMYVHNILSQSLTYVFYMIQIYYIYCTFLVTVTYPTSLYFLLCLHL